MTEHLSSLEASLRDSQTIEDKISHFAHALDALTERFDVSTQNLLEGVEDGVKSSVMLALRSASKAIQVLADEHDAIGRADVAGRFVLPQLEVERAFNR
jgi:hypothetical protein